MTTLQELVPLAAEAADWKADQISHSCFGAQTGFAAVPLVFVRVSDATAGPNAVLDLCLPLASAVEDHSVQQVTGVNGAGAQIVSSAWFSDYEGADGGRYLGAFVRMPIPPTFVDPRPLGDLLRASVGHLWAASMMFGRYIERCDDTGRPRGCQPLSDLEVIPARPADPFAEEDS